MSRCDFFDGRYLLRCFLLDPRTPQKSSQRKRLCQASLKLMFELPTQNEEVPPFKNAPPELQRLNSLSLPAPSVTAGALACHDKTGSAVDKTLFTSAFSRPALGGTAPACPNISTDQAAAALSLFQPAVAS